MSTKIFAVAPYHHPSGGFFKELPYHAWMTIGGKEKRSRYLPNKLIGLAYHIEMPTLKCGNQTARLRFVEALSISFDSFPDYIWSETVPFVWDCWPCYFEKTAKWLVKHKVKTAIFTSSQTAEMMRKRLPSLNVMSVTEGIDTSLYKPGGDLASRQIDLLEYGSIKRNFFRNYVTGINHINAKNANGCMDSWDQMTDTMSSAKVTIALPRCDTDPEFTGGIETLTQRFWECMLSRTVLLGRAPRELVDLLGYNPVIELDKEHPDEQVRQIVEHISDYQELVDKNRKVALKMAPWELRMKQVMDWLVSLGYEI